MPDKSERCAAELWMIEVGSKGHWAIYQRSPFSDQAAAETFAAQSNEWSKDTTASLEYRVVKFVRAEV